MLFEPRCAVPFGVQQYSLFISTPGCPEARAEAVATQLAPQRGTSSYTVKVKVAQSCPTLCHPMGYTVHGILQARILEWEAFPFSRGIFPNQGSIPGLLHCRRILYQLSHKGSPRTLEWVAHPFSSGSSQPKNQMGSLVLHADSLPTEP